MNTDSGPVPANHNPEDAPRRSGSDRRAELERRRSGKGLLELRARKEAVSADRRQRERRDGAVSRWWQNLWRRQS